MATEGPGIWARVRLLLDKASAQKVERDTRDALERGTDSRRARGNLSAVSSGMEGIRKLAVRLGGVLAAAFSVRAIMRFGSEVEQARRTLVRMTGASGTALRGLQNDVRAIFATVPESLGEVATAVGTLNTLIGITGDELRRVTRASLDFARANEVDVATATDLVGKLLNRFNLEAEHAIPFMDRLTLAGQATGASVNVLASNLLQAGPALATFGFSINEQIALVAELERRGIPAAEVTRRLGMSLSRFAQAGARDGAEAFRMLIAEIEEAETDLEAVALATEIFGTRGGALALDIRQGIFAIDDMAESLRNADGRLRETEKNSRTAGQEFRTMANALWAQLIPAVEFLTGLLLRLGTFVFRVLDGGIRMVKASVDLLGLAFLDVQRRIVEVRIGINEFLRRSTDHLERERERIRIQRDLTIAAINDLFTAATDVEGAADGAADAFDRVREMAAGAADATAATAEEAKAAEDDRLALLEKAAAHRVLEAEGWREVLGIVRNTTAAIAAGNLAMEDRVRLADRLARATAIVGRPDRRAIDPTIQRRDPAAITAGATRIDPLPDRDEVSDTARWVVENLETIEFAGRGAAIGVQNAFQQAFASLGAEGDAAANFFENVFRGMAASALTAIADVAAVKVQENIAKAIEATASGLLGNPGAFAAAGKYTLAAAKWAAVGGAAGAAAGAVGGGTTAGFRGADTTGRAVDRLDRGGPEIHLHIDGVDPANPRHQELIGRAGREYTERYGGRITVEGR